MSRLAAERLTSAALDAALSSLPGWSAAAASPGGATGLHKKFAFASFSAAWGWMSRVALLAEARDHHPEWSNVYSKVDVRLTTHDAGGVTAKDTAFAAVIEGYYAQAAAAAPPR